MTKRKPYGPHLGYRPIRLFVRSEAVGKWQHVVSTIWFATCRDACDDWAKRHPDIARCNIRGRFA